MQNNLFAQLLWIRRFGATERFHGVNMLFRKETVFHHSASTAMILIQIFGELCTSNLLRAVLQHDLEECITGDIPAPSKLLIRKAFDLDILEAEIRDFYEIHYPTLDSDEKLILKAADTLDGVMTCLEQRLNGNTSLDWVFDNYRQYISSSKVLEGFSETRVLWTQVLSTWKELIQSKPLPAEVQIAEQYNFWAKGNTEWLTILYGG